MSSPTRKLQPHAWRWHLLALMMATLWPLFALTAPAEDLRGEYFERLAGLHPRSASAHTDLAEWCAGNGLAEYATECYRRAIAIDTDCRRAREALGYQRYGTVWLEEGEKPPLRKPRTPSRKPDATAKTTTKTGNASPDVRRPPAPTVPSGNAGTEKVSSPEVASPDISTPGEDPRAVREPAPEEPPTTTPEPKATKVSRKDAIALEIERKLALAEAASAKISVTFHTYEDTDFLIHTTLSGSSRELKLLVSNLKAMKKTLTGVLGMGSSTRMWPDKLQFFLLKSNPEFTRFAEMVDGVKSADFPEGAYSTDDYTVVLRPNTEILPRLLGQTALRKLNGSNRYVGWWLQEGLGEWMFAQSPAGLAAKYYATTLLYASEVLKADGQSLKIFDLIETPDYKAREAGRNQALAFTLVDYLARSRRRGLQQVITKLKSDEAPVPPESEEEFKSFYLSYVSFQEEAIRGAYRLRLDELDEKWKQFVIATGEALKAQAASQPDPNRTPRKGRR